MMLTGYSNYVMLGVLVMSVWYYSILITLYLSLDVTLCSLFGGKYRVIEKIFLKMLFLWQHFWNSNIIFIKLILVLASGSAYHLCGSSIDSVSKACLVWFNNI